jgi:hypothetical protein
LSSPWDLAWDPVHRYVDIAMAGNHTLAEFDVIDANPPLTYAGTTNEGLLDGPLGRGVVRPAVGPRLRR